MNGTGGDIRLDERRGDTEISNSQKLILNAEDLLESNLGCDLFTEGGDKRFGWLLTFASVCLVFPKDGSTFKAKHKFRPYFYVATKNKLEMEVDAYLRRQYEAQIADIEITEKEDLDLKNHLSGLQKSYLKITFDTVQQMMHVKRDLMHTIEGNRTKFDAMEANESILTRKSKHGFQDYIDCIADFREHDVPYHVRFSIDNDVRCGQWYEVSVHSSGVVLERRRDLLQHAEVHVCAFDTEMTKAPLKGPNADCDSIMMISYMVDGQGYLIINREYVGEDIEDLEYSPKPEYKGCFKVTNVKNEEELLRTWFSHMQVIKPSIYVTYSGDSNDWPFMETRAAHHGFNMKNELGFQCDKSKGECRAKFACHMDCFAWAKHDSYLPPGCHGLKNQGKDIADSELLDYISESITLSTSLADCGEQKSCAVTTAKRLRDFLGDAMVKDKGLCCQYIVACEPKGTPVTERAIPVAIFKTNTENMKLYIKKWCKISSDSKTSIRSIVDWSYYKRRLCSMIQKKITIPAAMQKVANPVPRVPHPSWLLKRVNEKEEKFRSHQQELEDMNGSMSRENKSAGADLEDMGKAGKSYVIAPRPIVHSHGVNKRVKDLVDKSG